MYETLFLLAGLATPLWLLLICAPAWQPVRRLADSAVVPLFLCVLYLIGSSAVLVQFGPSILADFGSAAGVTKLLAKPAIGLVAWLHILAFDQLVGLYIYRDNMANRHPGRPLMTLALRYGMGSVMLAAAVGIWMVVLRGPLDAGSGGTLLVHALGFHGLQAVPLVAWLLERSATAEASARRWVHTAGSAWLAGTLFLGAHTALGLPASVYSPALAATAVALMAWAFAAVTAAGSPARQAA